MVAPADRRKSTASAPDIRDLWPSWERHLKSDRKSPRTLESYGYALRQFGDYLAASGHPTALGAITRADIEAWTVDLMDPPSPAKLTSRQVAPRSARGYQAVLRIFFGWAVDERLIEHSPTERMKLVKYDRTRPQVAPDRDLLLVVAAAEADRTKEGVRDAAILRLLYDTGMRREECADLRLADLNLDRLTVHIVRGKGAKERTNTFGPDAAKALDRYVRPGGARSKFAGADETDFLWLGRKGPGDIGLIRNTVERRAAAVGVHLRPHDLRRAWTSRMVASGMPREYIQALGGWDDETMIRQYQSYNEADQAILDAQRRLFGAATGDTRRRR